MQFNLKNESPLKMPLRTRMMFEKKSKGIEIKENLEKPKTKAEFWKTIQQKMESFVAVVETQARILFSLLDNASF